jgi:hypothetical protein
MRQATIRHEMEKVILSKICKSVSPDEIQAIVAKCIYQATNDYFNQVESIRLKVPSEKEVEKMVKEPDFDEMEIASYIKRNFPGWPEDRIDEELDHIELMYEKEHTKQLESVTNTVANEFSHIDNAIKKEIQSVKQKLSEKYHK